MVGMERCLLVERVGENGASIGVLDSKIWVKEQKRWSGVQREKRKEKGRNGAEESRGANKTETRAASSRAALHDAARVSCHAPKWLFKSRAASSHPVRSSSTPGMSVWTPEELARKSRQTARQPWPSTRTEKNRAGKNRVICSLSDVPCAKKRQTKKGQLS